MVIRSYIQSYTKLYIHVIRSYGPCICAPASMLLAAARSCLAASNWNSSLSFCRYVGVQFVYATTTTTNNNNNKDNDNNNDNVHTNTNTT